MKKLLVLTLATFMITVGASAQVERASKDSGFNKEKRLNGKGNGQSKKAHLIKDLGLNKDQMSQMKTINQDTKTKMQALKAQDNITVKEMNVRKKAIMDERQAKVKAILTPEQFAKMQAMKNNKMKHHKGKKAGADMDDDLNNI